MTFLSSFFKSPLAVEENDFGRQFQTLEAWAAALAPAKPARRSALTCGSPEAVLAEVFRALNRPRATHSFLLRFPPLAPLLSRRGASVAGSRVRRGGAIDGLIRLCAADGRNDGELKTLSHSRDGTLMRFLHDVARRLSIVALLIDADSHRPQ